MMTFSAPFTFMKPHEPPETGTQPPDRLEEGLEISAPGLLLSFFFFPLLLVFLSGILLPPPVCAERDSGGLVY